MDNRLERIGSRLLPDAVAAPLARSVRRYAVVVWYIVVLAAVLFVGFAAYTIALYQQRYGTPKPEYVLFDTRSFDWSAPVRDAYFPLVGDEYGLYRYQDGIWILKRGYNGSPTGIAQSPSRERVVFEADEFAASEGRVKNGRLVDSGGANGSNVWHGPYTALPAGNYTATFRLSAGGGGANGSAATVDVAVGEEPRTIARQRVPAATGTQRVTVPFTLEEPRNGIEFRGFRTGYGTIALESVVVQSGTNGTAAGR